MQWIGNKLLCLFVEIIGLITQTANLFLANIAIYESTTGFHFDFSALLHNTFFWITVVIQVVYFFASLLIRKTNRETDDIVENALRDGSVKLVAQIVSYSEKGDFVSANKAVKIFRKLQKKRR